MNMESIPVSGPSITQKEIDYVVDAVKNAWYGQANLYHERFEKTFADYVGRRYAIALPSCTSALHLSLLALNVGISDEVIVPDVTWIATAAPCKYVGATPVFADIDNKSWCISLEALKACVTARTKVIIVVDLYGNMPDMDALLAFADARGIAVVEDAAEALGSEYKGRKAGSFGITSVFSFHGSKTMTTYEGGMLVTDSKELYERVLFLRDHGRYPGDVSFYNHEIAYKYKMSSMQAALGLAQLERVQELVAYKRQIFDWYRRRLVDMEGVTLNYQAPEISNSYWMVTMLLDSSFGVEKEALRQSLKEYHVATRPFFYPLSSLPAYAGMEQALLAQKRNKVGYGISAYGINLPCSLKIDERQVDYVVASLRKILIAKSNH